jgi:hypothetical protein
MVAANQAACCMAGLPMVVGAKTPAIVPLKLVGEVPGGGSFGASSLEAVRELRCS